MNKPLGSVALRHPRRAAVRPLPSVSPATLQAIHEADATMSPDVWAGDYPQLAAAHRRPAAPGPKPRG